MDLFQQPASRVLLRAHGPIAPHRDFCLLWDGDRRQIAATAFACFASGQLGPCLERIAIVRLPPGSQEPGVALGWGIRAIASPRGQGVDGGVSTSISREAGQWARPAHPACEHGAAPSSSLSQGVPSRPGRRRKVPKGTRPRVACQCYRPRSRATRPECSVSALSLTRRYPGRYSGDLNMRPPAVSGAPTRGSHARGPARPLPFPVWGRPACSGRLLTRRAVSTPRRIAAPRPMRAARISRE